VVNLVEVEVPVLELVGVTVDVGVLLLEAEGAGPASLMTATTPLLRPEEVAFIK
jgi:hypothetical protein